MNTNENTIENYESRCDCADDDKCGCTYPNNVAKDYDLDNFDTTQSIETKTNLSIGMKAPNFTSPALFKNNTMIDNFNFYNYTKNKLSVLFFYSEDFNFTCPSELLLFNEEINSFKKRNTQIIGISTDSIYSHITWKSLQPEKNGISDVNIPLVADLNKIISTSYGVLNKKQTAHHATIIIDEKKIIKHISFNDNMLWRNPAEVIRILDILNNKSDKFTTCPMGWKQNFNYERPQKTKVTDFLANKDNLY